MTVPLNQALRVGAYVVKQHLIGRKRYPLVLMLEPLFRCNLACAGCGKIQYPAHILKAELSPEECFKAVVGLTAGASAPESLVQHVIDALGEIEQVKVEQMDGKKEHIEFRLPAELRA